MCRRIKIIISAVAVLLIALPITVFAVMEAGESKEYFSQARLEELQKKQEFIDSGKKSLTALEKGLPEEEQSMSEEEQSMSEEEIAALVEKDRLAEERGAIRKDYVKKTVAVINKTLHTNYGIELEFHYELMRAAVDTVKTGKLTAEEETLLKGYIGEYCCGVLGTDPMYDEIMDILDLPY